MAVFLVFWSVGTPNLPESFTIGPRNLLYRSFDVVPLVRIILRRNRSMSGPAANWSIRDLSYMSSYWCISRSKPVKCRCNAACSCFCCSEACSAISAWRLSILHVKNINARVASILMVVPPLPNVFELSNMYFRITIVRLIVSCQNTDKILSCTRFILMTISEKFSLLIMWSTSIRFALNIQSFLCSLCNQLNNEVTISLWKLYRCMHHLHSQEAATVASGMWEFMSSSSCVESRIMSATATSNSLLVS